MANNTTDLAKFWIEGVTSPIILTLGIFGNSLAIAVLLSKKLETLQSIRHLFVQLAIFDTLILVIGAIVNCPGNWSPYYREHYE